MAQKMKRPRVDERALAWARRWWLDRDDVPSCPSEMRWYLHVAYRKGWDDAKADVRKREASRA